VLKLGGKIVFSYLDYEVPAHWNIFMQDVDASIGIHPLNVFLSQETINAWASRLQLRVESLHKGDEAFIPLSEPVKLESGQILERFAYLGQSVCVLVK